MTSILDAILAINPNAKIVVHDDDVNKIDWQQNTKPISTEDILKKQKELQTAYANNEYQRKRRFEYPPVEDQLDDLYHNGIDGWKKTIKAIKDKYPKG